MIASNGGQSSLVARFEGGYADEMAEVLAVSLLAGANAIVLGSPGWGKTAVARSLAQQMVDRRWSFTRVDPSSAPDKVFGILDFKAYMDGRRSMIVAGTPYDPAVRVAIIDEIGRANEAMFDALLDTLDRVDANGDAPAVWATSNFIPSTDRVAALIDRFALWYWVQPGPMDIGNIVAAQLAGMHSGGPQVAVPGGLTWEEVEEIRAMAPGPRAVKAVQNLVRDLESEAKLNKRRPNPRRATQWSFILYRASAWHTGQADFTTVPDAASRLLKYAWPAVTAEEQATWATVATSVTDVVGAQIEAGTIEVQEYMKQIVDCQDEQEKGGLVLQATIVIQNALATIKAVAGDEDPRYGEAARKFNQWVIDAAQGKELS
jgi:MoxR-like ATPase